MGGNISEKTPRSRGEYGSSTPRHRQGVFEPYSPLTSQGKVVLQFILRPTEECKPDLLSGLAHIVSSKNI